MSKQSKEPNPSLGTCSISGGCKALEKIYAITSSKNGKTKVHRLTFSSSLASLICERHPEYKVQHLAFRVGKRLESGQTSQSGLYALVATKSSLVLRISLFKEVASLHEDLSNRHLAEAWIDAPDLV